jgi:hypothetical protein
MINASSMRDKLTFFDTISGKPASVHCITHSTLSDQSDRDIYLFCFAFVLTEYWKCPA